MLTGSGATIGNARELRRRMSLPEALLWRELRMRPGGLKFRRQHPAGPFILDFVCLSARLAIEVDGEAHNMGGNPERDVERDEWLMSQGFRTLRIAARDVLGDLEAVVCHIVATCQPLHHAAHGPPPRTGAEF